VGLLVELERSTGGQEEVERLAEASGQLERSVGGRLKFERVNKNIAIFLKLSNYCSLAVLFIHAKIKYPSL